MIVLGIDPGTATTGFSIIKRTTGKQDLFEIVDFGVITTPKTASDAERLAILATDLGQLIEHHKPERAGIEKLFFTTNQKTAITVAQARGVTLMLCQHYGMSIFEFTPLQVKNMVCGYGKADKKQMQEVVRATFKLKTIPKPDDAADALAIALCAGLARENPRLR